MTYNAEIISVGTELLLGHTTNTDAKDVAEMLSELGINLFFQTVVGDNPERLKSAVEIAKSRADIIITTGGLGPTYDDLTKQTLAGCFGKKLIYDEAEAERMRNYYTNVLRRTNMTQNNYQQAYLPEGCTVFHNEVGTAPGCAFESEGRHVIMLPGPPRECRSMIKNSAKPYLKELSEYEIISHNIHIFGMGESAVEDKLRDLMLELKNPTLAPYAKEGEMVLRVTAKTKTREEAEEMMAPIIEKVHETLGPVIYGVDVDSLENFVGRLLTERGLTLAVAESCTGGLLTKRITDIPGASKYFLGGVVAYSNEVKVDLLGVDEEVLAAQGAVSADVAVLMARGVRERLGSDIGIGITGIAGPASDDTQKAVGTVFIALSDGTNDYWKQPSMGVARDRIRTMSTHNALDMIRRYLTGLDMG